MWKKRAAKRRIPYPFVPPPASKVNTWDEYFIWSAARYRARDNYGRLWRNHRVSLPETCAEWDPPIPLPPPGAGPKPKVGLKNADIPPDWNFEAKALTMCEQDQYKKALREQLSAGSASAGREE